MPFSHIAAARLYLAALMIVASSPIHAQDDASMLRDIETKYVFGFTEGSGIGLEGEKEVSLDTEARMGKGGKRYWGSESKLEFEFTPNQYVQFELGPFASAHSIRNVPGLDDRSQFEFGGFFGEMRYLLVERGPSSPWSVTLSAEPEWRHIDETGGERVDNVELELKLNADLELVPQRFYFAANLLYEPEGTRDPDHVGAGWEMESKGGLSAALAYRIMPSVLVGGELWYLRHYDGAWFNHFTGDAVYAGPTLFIQLNPKMFVKAAWNVQLHGSDVEVPDAKLNLSEFSHHRFKLKVAAEF